jgi:pimeloyl-ACP methyl ester carboxylesterase
MMRWLAFCLTLLLATLAGTSHATGTLFKVPTREGVVTTLFWAPAAGAKATVLLFPGGAGGFGKVENGVATGNNFLVRSVPYFEANGLNVAIFGRPSDAAELGYEDRITDSHLADISQVLDFVHSLAGTPVWLVGTSRGTLSAAAAAIRLQDRVAGLVLSSSVVSSQKTGAVPTQDLAAIRLPVLVLHHTKDACAVCKPSDIPAILAGLTQARSKTLLMVDGGANPSGNPCSALHWHGYIGMEKQAVDLIAGWLGRMAP